MLQKAPETAVDAAATVERNPITDLDVVAQMVSRSTVFGIACKHAKASADFGGKTVTGPVIPTSVIAREDDPHVFDVTFPVPLTPESAQAFREAVADARTYTADPEAQARADAAKANPDGSAASIPVVTVPSDEPIGYRVGEIIAEREFVV